MALLVILGGMGAWKAMDVAEQRHQTPRAAKAVNYTRRAMDPVTVDKALAPGQNGSKAAPKNLQGSYAGTGASRRNARNHLAIRGYVPDKRGRLNARDRLRNLYSVTGYSELNSEQKGKNVVLQGKSIPIGDDYKPQTPQFVGITSVDEGMTRIMYEQQQYKYGPLKKAGRVEHPVRGAYLNYSTINQTLSPDLLALQRKKRGILNSAFRPEVLPSIAPTSVENRIDENEGTWGYGYRKVHM
jgi:hypothetical protein